MPARFWHTLAILALAWTSGLAPAAAHEPRNSVDLGAGWRFHAGDLTDALAPGLADETWDKITVPHSWNRAGYYRAGKVGTNTPDTVNTRQGISWYRLHFTAPKRNAPTDRQWLEFDAVSRTAQMWLNGRYLGEHRGGFSRFRLDVTEPIRAGDANLLVVKVDSSQPAAGNSTQDVLPLTGDFFVHGGIYRPVKLVTTSALHFDMADFGGPGVYAVTRSATAETAMVALRVRATNETAKSENATLRLSLLDKEGKVAATVTRSVVLPAGGTTEVSSDLTLAQPHLWHGVADPYLYTLAAEIIRADNSVVDRLSQRLGIRTMGFDPDQGFVLNGKPYNLRGVGYHQDRDGKGWAISQADVEEDVATMREMGVNTIRLTHYQHGSDIHDIADRTGIILWDEIPLVSLWTLGNSLDPLPTLVDNSRQQLTELIRQNQNHAATAIWGLANEVDLGDSLPFLLPKNRGNRLPDPGPLLGQLNELAKTLDPSRPTAISNCCEEAMQRPGLTIPITATHADLGGANRYFGWYMGNTGDLGPHLDLLHARRPTQPLGVTEYGAGGALSIHTDNVQGARADAAGRGQPEEYQTYVHQTALAQIGARPWLYSTWAWSAFDFATRIRAEGDSQDINTKGLIAYDHKTRKDAWYLYKANWNPAPMVYIASKRYVSRAYPVTDITVFSNAGATELLINGRSLGTRSNCPQQTCVWSEVALDQGQNLLVAQGRFADRQVQDQARWTLASRNRFVIDTGTLVVGPGDKRVLGSDNWFSGGQTASLDVPADFGRPAQPATITGTRERDALATYRHGNFTYRIPVQDGRYRVTLWFATTATQGPGSFNVKSGRKVLVANLRPAAPASDVTAEAKTFTLKAKGSLVLEFVSGTAEARVSEIEIERVR